MAGQEGLGVSLPASLLRELDRAVLDIIWRNDGAAPVEAVLVCRQVRKAVQDGLLSPTLVELQTGRVTTQLQFRWHEGERRFVRRGIEGEHAIAGARLRARVQRIGDQLEEFPRCLFAPNLGDLSDADGAPLSGASGGAHPQRTEAKAKLGVSIVTVTAAALPAALSTLRAFVGPEHAVALKKGVPNRIRVESDIRLRARALRALEALQTGGEAQGSAAPEAVLVDVLDKQLSVTLTKGLEALAAARQDLATHLSTPPTPTDPRAQKTVRALVRALQAATVEDAGASADTAAAAPLLLGEFTLEQSQPAVLNGAGLDAAMGSGASSETEPALWLGTVGIAPLIGWVRGNGCALLERVKQLSGCTRIDVVVRPGRGDAVVTAAGPEPKVVLAVQFVRVFVQRRFAYNPEHPALQFQHRRSQQVLPEQVAHLVGAGGRNLFIVMIELGVGLVCLDETLHMGAHSAAGLDAVLVHPNIAPYLV